MKKKIIGLNEKIKENTSGDRKSGRAKMVQVPPTFLARTGEIFGHLKI